MPNGNISTCNLKNYFARVFGTKSLMSCVYVIPTASPSQFNLAP